MAQDKEMQNMLIQERYERMDWVTYGNEQMRKGMITGKIIGAVETMMDDGKTNSEIVERLMAKYGLTRNEAEEAVRSAEPEKV